MGWLHGRACGRGCRGLVVVAVLFVLALRATADTVYYYFPVASATAPGNQPPWPTAPQWVALTGLETDPVDVAVMNSENDFVGNVAGYPAPAASWYNGTDYLFFRMQVVSTVPLADYNTPLVNDVFRVIIDRAGYGSRIDYSFGWDTQTAPSISNHGLELNLPDAAYTTSTLWSAVDFHDADGSNGQKLHPDFDSLTGAFISTGTDGYIRASQSSTSTFIDFAVSWNYLTQATTLTRSDTLYVAMATQHTGNDHSSLSSATDIIGASTGNNLGSGFSGGINPVPEPGSALLVMCAAGVLAGCRRPRRRSV